MRGFHSGTFFFKHCVTPLFVNFVLNGLAESIQPGNPEYLSDTKRR